MMQAVIEFELCKCIQCGVYFGVDKERISYLRRQANAYGKSEGYYCPNGHGQHKLGENEVDKQRRRAERAEQENARLREQRDRAYAVVKHHSQQIQRHQKRSAAGVCPCCKRTFKQLQAHMKTKHPEFVKTHLATEESRA